MPVYYRRCATIYGPADYSIRARRLLGAERLVGEFLAGNGGCVHESTLCDGEYRHAFLVDAARSGVFLATTGSGRRAAGAHARRSAGGDRDRARAGGELERSGFEFVQRTLILEENHLAIRLAAGLESAADLTHGGVADGTSVNVNMTLAQSAADDETRF